jgi:vacuolar-type H+-ATPase subunit F/Vma7
MLKEAALENSLAIIGDEDVVAGFKALGFKVYPIQNSQDQMQSLAKAVNDRVAICLVQEDIYRSGQDFIGSYRSFTLPIFIPFSKGAKNDLLEGMIKDIRLKATGAL